MRRESSSRSRSMSYRAIVEPLSGSENIQSPRTFFAKIVLPAPMNVILGMLTPCV